MHPSLLATERMAAHWEGCSWACSCSNRTARSRSSGEYLLGRGIGCILSQNEPCDKLGPVHLAASSEGKDEDATLADVLADYVRYAINYLKELTGELDAEYAASPRQTHRKTSPTDSQCDSLTLEPSRIIRHVADGESLVFLSKMKGWHPVDTAPSHS